RSAAARRPASESSSPCVMTSSSRRTATLSGNAIAVACASPWMVPSPSSRTNELMSGTFGRWRRHAARLHSSMLSIVPRATASDGVGLQWEESGSGTPILFVHEFAGDHRSWVPQVSHFAKSHRCITYAARGYPPSDVPRDVSSYSQARAGRTPLLILACDKYEGSLEPSLMLKRTLPTSALAILPRTGHTLNLEEPELFNTTVERFMAAVENGEWGARDPRATAGSITGVRTS